MYDYSRRLDLSQPWPANLVLKISKQFLVVFHKNSRWIFSIDAKTFSKSVRCYQSKRPIFKSLLNFCSDLAKKCAFFLKNAHVSNIRRVPCKTNIIMQFTPHILHNYSLFSIYSQSKNGVSRRKNCYISWKCSSSFIIQQQKGNFDLQEYRHISAPEFRCISVLGSELLPHRPCGLYVLRYKVYHILFLSARVCAIFADKKDPRGCMPAGIPYPYRVG